MSDIPTVLVHQHDGFVEIVLNRPDRLNAFTKQLHAELLAALKAADGDEGCKAVLLTGAGRGFCAGQDLTERVFVDGEVPDLSENLVERYNPLISFIRHARVPVVAAVNGVAAGAGASLAFACDIVIAAHTAKFMQAFAKIGLIPDAGGTWTLPRIAGDARARAMIMLAEPVSAELAVQWGMIWKVVDDALLHDEAVATCRRLAALPGSATALAKRALLGSSGNDLDAQLTLEAELQRQAGEHPEYRLAVEAFRRKG
ncbi:enoyl-CoA hydratase-related protein [Mesorhizobium sp. CAU 1741]|uniref:enoyl-CoA hydratase-related protein n=1 Tax=Mesorhizobium sp. CAU 1741 TaxID=3140366 RepID=UPI00325B071F